MTQDITGDIADISKSVTAAAGALSSLRGLLPRGRNVALKDLAEVTEAIRLLTTLAESHGEVIADLSKRMDRIEDAVTATGTVAIRADRVAMALKATVEPIVGKREWARLEVLSQLSYEETADYPRSERRDD